MLSLQFILLFHALASCLDLAKPFADIIEFEVGSSDGARILRVALLLCIDSLVVLKIYKKNHLDGKLLMLSIYL